MFRIKHKGERIWNGFRSRAVGVLRRGLYRTSFSVQGSDSQFIQRSSEQKGAGSGFDVDPANRTDLTHTPDVVLVSFTSAWYIVYLPSENHRFRISEPEPAGQADVQQIR